MSIAPCSHASECWALTVADEARLQRNDRSMIRWICGVKWDDRVSSESLLSKLSIPSLVDLLRCHRLLWYGHVKRNSVVLQDILDLQVQGGTCGRGRPKKSWAECFRNDQDLECASRWSQQPTQMAYDNQGKHANIQHADQWWTTDVNRLVR